MTISSTYVPNEGPPHADILIVGEAPGEDEEHARRPFIGKSGQLLERYLGRAGIRRHEVYLANLCHYRPDEYNTFRKLLGSSQLRDGLAELSETIQSVNPNVIVAAGNWPMWYLTGCKATTKNSKPGSGVMTWRGSFVPAIDDHIPLIAGRKVLITLHPAHVVRPSGFGWRPVFMTDLKKLQLDRTTPDFLYPVYDELIDPEHSILSSVAEEMAESEWLTSDIETFGDSLACIGFTDNAKRALVLTAEHPSTWDVAEFLLRSKAKKIFQFGTFDINWLRHFMNWKTSNYTFDTFIAANSISPEFPKRLDFLTSLYTRIPYYKEDRKTWKETGDLSTLWTYNGKDNIGTHIVAMKQMKELEERYR